MSFYIGGLGVVSFRSPLSDVASLLVDDDGVRSLVALLIFFIVFIVLAHLTNPSENSFRAYLTEQSFRQHLSRLDENIDDARNLQRDSHHFTNRASVSLRTPRHVFHTFGIFTIAAMLPVLPKTDKTDPLSTSFVSDTWFIGAFGRWWRAGPFEPWCPDMVTLPSDEESSSSGIVAVRTTDSLARRLLGRSRGTPPRLRNRERTAQYQSSSARSSTPPPLPKSATLPLHSIRTSQSSISLPTEQRTVASAFVPCDASSPRFAEVQHQIAISKSAVIELRAQLSDCQASAKRSHSTLQADADALRERKRQEDLAKQKVKAQTKSLDDAKRNAESLRKEAERKLKAACGARDEANNRIDFLDKEIERLQRRLEEDRAFLKDNVDIVSKMQKEAEDELQRKKREVKVAEDVVAALILRTKELEAKLASRREKLAFLREQTHSSFGQDLSGRDGSSDGSDSSSVKRIPVSSVDPRTSYAPAADLPTHIDSSTPSPSHFLLRRNRNRSASAAPSAGSVGSAIANDGRETVEILPAMELHPGFRIPVHISADYRSAPVDIRPSTGSSLLSSVRLSHLDEHEDLSELFKTLSSPTAYHPSPAFSDATVFHSSPPKHETLLSNAAHFYHRDSHPYDVLPAKPLVFSPFDSDLSSSDSTTAAFVQHGQSVISPTSQSLIPAGLISSLDSGDVVGFSRSFQSENDVVVDRQWRGNPIGAAPGQGIPRSPTTTTSGAHGLPARQNASSLSLPTRSSATFLENDAEYDPFKVRIPANRDRPQSGIEPLWSRQRATLSRSHSDANTMSLPLEPEPSAMSGLSYQQLHFQSPTAQSHGQDRPHRWFQVRDRSKKGLNPTAKAFTLPTDKPLLVENLSMPANDTRSDGTSLAAPPASYESRDGVRSHDASNGFYRYDALNPHGMVDPIAPASADESILRAFAPSKEERQVLQRVLSGSTNASLERLPSLSDVGTPGGGGDCDVGRQGPTRSLNISPSPAPSSTTTTTSLLGSHLAHHNNKLPWFRSSKPKPSSFSPFENEDA